MRKLLFPIFALLSSFGFGQQTFRLESIVLEQKVLLNGEEYTIDSVGTQVETNYPEFDTLQFIQRNSRNILCNFKPDSSYSITMACCGSLDIVPTTRQNRMQSLNFISMDESAEMEFIKSALLDRSTYSIQLKENNEDNVYFWSADYACEPKINIVSTRPSFYGTSNKCFFWSNIDFLNFFTQNMPLRFWVDDFGIRQYDYPDDDHRKTLGQVAVRFFDNHHFLVTLDPITEKVDIEYDD